MNIEATGLHQRKCNKEDNEVKLDIEVKRPKLTLVDEILLLGLNDAKGTISIWNTSISTGLRACILVELSFLGRIELQPAFNHKVCSPYRKIIIKDGTPTDDPVLDEALKIIKKANPPENIQNWIAYLNGETWNIFKLNWALKRLREKVSKNLVEKGVLGKGIEKYLLFDFATNPLQDEAVKRDLIKKVKSGLLDDWKTEPSQMEERVLALLFLAHISDVLEDALSTLDDIEYETATERFNTLLKLDFGKESSKNYMTELFWALMYNFLK